MRSALGTIIYDSHTGEKLHRQANNNLITLFCLFEYIKIGERIQNTQMSSSNSHQWRHSEERENFSSNNSIFLHFSHQIHILLFIRYTLNTLPIVICLIFNKKLSVYQKWRFLFCVWGKKNFWVFFVSSLENQKCNWNENWEWKLTISYIFPIHGTCAQPNAKGEKDLSTMMKSFRGAFKINIKLKVVYFFLRIQ